MRFMILVKADKDSEAGKLPPPGLFEAMGKYNEELDKAGVMLDGGGLQPSAKAAWVRIVRGQAIITDGPFAETKELVAGFWLWQVRSKEEALEWARRIPLNRGTVEIRQVAEVEDFGDALSPELRQQEQRLRDKVAAKRK